MFYKKCLALKSAFRFLVSFALAFGLMYLFFSKISAEEKSEMYAAFKNTNYWLLSVSVSFTFFSQLFRTSRYRRLINSMGYSLSFSKTFHAISINYLVNLVLPRFGEVARSVVLLNYNNISIEKSIGSTINERIVDLIMLLFIGILCVIFQNYIFIEFYNSYLSESMQSLWKSLSSNVWQAAIFFILFIVILGFVWKKILAHTNLSQKIVTSLIGLKEGLLSIISLKNPALFIFETVLIWICYFLMIYFAFKTIPQGSVLPLGAALSLLFFGTFGFLATPGGIGTYPIIAGYLLALYSLPEHLGNTIGWILWIGQTLLILSLGLIAAWTLGKEKPFRINMLTRTKNK